MRALFNRQIIRTQIIWKEINDPNYSKEQLTYYALKPVSETLKKKQSNQREFEVQVTVSNFSLYTMQYALHTATAHKKSVELR